MTALRFLSPLLFFVVACGTPEAAINAAIGDVSWRALHDSDPATADEDERIAVHLAWVEAKLRATEEQALTEAQSVRRAALLDELHAYQERRSFPRQAEGRGRLPRFVDSEGRHCAVAQLVLASAGPELVQQVQDRFEFALIEDMQLPALDAWASNHGLTRHELAMIQPSYDDGSGVHMPTPWEEEQERLRAEAAARVPRDLTVQHVQSVLEQHVANRSVVQRCAGPRLGEWEVKTNLRVRRGFRVRADVVATDREGNRDPGLEECLGRSAREAMDTFVESANHRFRRTLRAEREQTLVVATEDEVAGQLVAQSRVWHGSGNRQLALAACLEGTSEPLALSVRVLGWQGYVQMTWQGTSPMRMPRPERLRFHCIQDVINYGGVERYGTRDYNIDLVVNLDGTLQRR